MVRPREFDETEVLGRALCVFWARGFEGTAISDLVEATGLQRQSLYNAFTDKNGLFRASLARYIAVVRAGLAPLDAPDAGLAALRTYMEGALAVQQREGFGACLLVKTAFGPEHADPAVRAAVEEGAGAVRARFAAVLGRAKARGELARHVDPAASASFLYTVLNGLAALARTGGDRAHVSAVLGHALESLAAPKVPTKKRRRS